MRDIKNMIEDIKTEDMMKVDIRTFSLNLSTTKILDEISDTTKINKTKLVSLLLSDCFERYSIKDIEDMFKRKTI